MEFVFLTDAHVRKSSNVRTDKDYLETICKKLEFAVQKANEWGAQLVMGGDFFDTPTVPDLVKSAVVRIMKKADKKPWTIYGNHCTTFNNVENNYKTSTYLLNEDETWRAFISGEDFIYEDGSGQKCKVAFTRPMQNCGLPQLGIFHGFLNQEDGSNTFLFEDVPTEDPCVICLGHDHVQYEPVAYHNSVIYRIGALVRGIRNDSEIRTPQILRIKLKKDNTWITKLYDVPCVDPSLIFKEKKGKADKIQNDYQGIIDQIKAASAEDISLIQAVSMVSTEETVEYIREVLTETKNIRESK